MNAFVIVALVITVGYIAYYSAIIMQDLYGKKDANKSEAEVFDMNGMEEEEAIAVGEDDYSLHDEVPEQSEAVSVSFVDNMEQCNDLLTNQKEGGSSVSAKEECRNLAENLEDVEVDSTGGIPAEDLAHLLLESKSGKPKIFISSNKI